MKRWTAFGAAMLLLVCAKLALAEGGYLSLRQLRSQLPDRWTQTYRTPWREVEIDAAILVPEADQVPVMLIAGGMETPALTAEEVGWDKLVSRSSYSLTLANHDASYPKSVDGKRINQNQEPGGTWSDANPETAYVPMSDISLGEICDLADEALHRLGYDPQEYTLRSPYRMWAQHVYFYGYKRDALPGSLFFQCYQKLESIPLLGHIKQAVVDRIHGENRLDEYWEIPEIHLGYNGYTRRLSHLFLWHGKPVELLAQDVPLCPLDRVLAAIEPEIQGGHIRRVFEVELGYVMFNPPGVYRGQKAPTAKGGRQEERSAVRYYVKPMWRVNCLWVDNPRAALRPLSPNTDDERSTLDYVQLLFDAQTGERVMETQAHDRCEFNGFLRWEEAR